MESNNKTSSVLNELIEINNDRVAGFEKAIADIKDENIDLKAVFQEFATQSRKYSQELSALVGANNGSVETGNSVSGTLHRAWIDIKSIFGANDREGILNEAGQSRKYSQELGELVQSMNAEIKTGICNPASFF